MHAPYDRIPSPASSPYTCSLQSRSRNYWWRICTHTYTVSLFAIVSYTVCMGGWLSVYRVSSYLSHFSRTSLAVSSASYSIHTYIPLPAPPVTGLGSQSASVHNFWQLRFQLGHIPPCSYPPLPPVPLWPSIAHRRVVSPTHYYQREESMYVCKPVLIGACMYAKGRWFRFFAASTSCVSPQRPRQCFRM
jgi:hypothetical protein